MLYLFIFLVVVAWCSSKLLNSVRRATCAWEVDSCACWISSFAYSNPCHSMSFHVIPCHSIPLRIYAMTVYVHLCPVFAHFSVCYLPGPKAFLFKTHTHGWPRHTCRKQDKNSDTEILRKCLVHSVSFLSFVHVAGSFVRHVLSTELTFVSCCVSQTTMHLREHFLCKVCTTSHLPWTLHEHHTSYSSFLPSFLPAYIKIH